MLLSTPALALTLHLALASGSVAVVDLSATPSPAFAEALRKGPGVKGRALPAAQTAAVVEDAKGLGLACRVADDACLEKLLVLLRADELVAFSLERGSVKLARVAADKSRATVRAKVRFAAPATTARAALAALANSAVDSTAPVDAGGSAGAVAPAEDARPPAAAEPPPAARTLAEAGETADGGFSPMLLTGVVGGVVSVGCGAGAVATSFDLARRQRQAADDGVPLVGTDYESIDLAFKALLVCSAAGAVASGVGVGLFLLEEPAAAP